MLAGFDRAYAGVADRPGRRKIGLADFHVHDGAPRRLKLFRAREQLHHVERRDLRHAPRKRRLLVGQLEIR
jgi:hypothetical protein